MNLGTTMPENKPIKIESPSAMSSVGSLYHGDSPSGSGGLVAIENSTPEVIHVVNVTNAHRTQQMAALESALSSMQTITIPAGSLNFPINLVSNLIQEI